MKTQISRHQATLLIRRTWLLIVLSLCRFASFAGEPAPASNPVVIGYVFPQNKIIQPGEIAAQHLTRINYAFANLQGGKIVNGFPSDAANFAALNALKHQNPSLTVLVSIGGWGWSENFSDMVLTAQSRAVFNQSVIEFIDRYQLDGLDVDWEYPGIAGATNHFRAEDKQNFTLLLKELRQRFDREEKRLHRRLYLSIAAAASTHYLSTTEMDQAQKYLDTVNLMTYDYYEAPPDKITGNHAPLFADPADPKKLSVDKTVQEFEQAGVPAEKIVLGVPFFGRAWGSVSSRNRGLFQPGKPIPSLPAKYSDIAERMLNRGFTRYWDSASSVPYLYSPAEKVFVSYEDSESLTVKCKYIRDRNLAGIMFWHYSDDPSGALLASIHTALHHVPNAKRRGK